MNYEASGKVKDWALKAEEPEKAVLEEQDKVPSASESGGSQLNSASSQFGQGDQDQAAQGDTGASWWYIQAQKLSSASTQTKSRATAQTDLPPQPSPQPSQPTPSTPQVDTGADWWFQQLSGVTAKSTDGYRRQSSIPSNRSPQPSRSIRAGQTIHTKAVGVTFEGRQRTIAQMTVNEAVWLVREPTNPHDRNAIKVVRQNGQAVGYISRELAAELAPIFDRYGDPVRATVTAVTGREYWDGNLGVNLRFTVPS